MEIDAPANGAVYSPGQVVDANWSCSQVPGWGFGAQNCAATTANGAPVNTTLGTHTFTVTRIAQNNSEPVSASGSVKIPLGHLSAGSHTLKLVILVWAAASHHKPRTRTLTVRLSFVIC